MLERLNKAWLHFIAIGLCLYIAQQWIQPPEPRIIFSPSADKIAELRGQWLRSTGQPPSEQQLQRLIDNEINQEILFQEALQRNWHLTDTVVRQRLIRDMRFLDPESTDSDAVLMKAAMGLELHENDLVVRRRLIQRMEMQAYGPVRQMVPEPGILQSRFQQQAEQLMRPALLAFQHVFISRDRHPEPKRQAREWLEDIDGVDDLADALKLSHPFLHGLRFNRLSEQQISRYFGVDFSAEVMRLASTSAEKGVWLGPLTSSYGEHLVWIEAYQPAERKSFEEAEKQLLVEWRREMEQQALTKMLRRLRSNYQVQAMGSVAING